MIPCGAILVGLVASHLAVDGLEGRPVRVAVTQAINVNSEDLERATTGMVQALRAFGADPVARSDAPFGCSTDEACIQDLRRRHGPHEFFEILLVQIGDQVRFEGVRAGDSGSLTLRPWRVPVADLDAPGSHVEGPLPPPPPVPGPRSGPAQAASQTRSLPERPVPPGVWVLGGVSLAALGTGIGLGVAALGTERSLEADGCSVQACDPNRVDRLTREATGADVAYGIAAASAAAAIVWFVLRPRKTPVGLELRPGGGVTLGATF